MENTQHNDTHKGTNVKIPELFVRVRHQDAHMRSDCARRGAPWGGRPPRGPVGGGAPAEGPRGGDARRGAWGDTLGRGHTKRLYKAPQTIQSPGILDKASGTLYKSIEY